MINNNYLRIFDGGWTQQRVTLDRLLDIYDRDTIEDIILTAKMDPLLIQTPFTNDHPDAL